LIVSDHGFHSDHLRPLSIPKEPAGPAVQHRPTGILAMMGAGIRQDVRIDGATLLDITPTILTLFGLPVGDDMDGRVLRQAFDNPPEVNKIPSWEWEPGACGMHSDDLRTDIASSRAVLEQFVALGYIEAPSEDQKKAAEVAVREQKYNLARVYLFSRRPREAVPLFEELARADPNEERFARHLAQCYVTLARHDDAQQVIETLLATVEKPGAIADWLRGEMLFERGNTDGALEALLRAEQFDPQLPDLHVRIAQTYLRRGKIDEAERALSKALGIDPDSVEAHLWMARVRLRQRRDVEAADEALSAVGLEHFLPLGHFFLGVALTRLGRFKRAIQAFETALSLAPGLAPAHRWLARLHSWPRGDRSRATQHMDWLHEHRARRRVAAAAP
jgi:tetratricopeptide (TPR) repeat protein